MRTRVLEFYRSAVLQAAALACLLAVWTLFVLSGSVLDSFGYHHGIEGGPTLEKLHPAKLRSRCRWPFAPWRIATWRSGGSGPATA